MAQKEQKPPAFQLYARDWLVSTAALSSAEQGVYMRLLCHEWVEGPLPSDEHILARLAGESLHQFRGIWRRIERHFPALPGGGFGNPRLEAERQRLAALRQERAASGRKGARSRWERTANG